VRENRCSRPPVVLGRLFYGDLGVVLVVWWVRLNDYSKPIWEE
jgi:hypothetical protein